MVSIVTHNNQEFSVRTRNNIRIIASRRTIDLITARIRYPSQLTSINHCLYFLWISKIMSIENARCSRHCQEISIGSQRILTDRVWVVTARCSPVLNIMIFNKGYGILLISTIIYIKPRKSCITKNTPIILIDSITNSIAECKVEGSTTFSCGINPCLYSIRITVPILTYRVLYICCCIIITNMRSTKSLHHIISEASISEVVKQIVFVCFNNLLNVRTLVIKVAHTAPTFSFVIVLTELSTRFSCFRGSCSTVIISTDVRRQVLIRHSIIYFRRKAKPSVVRSVMINHYIGNRPNMLLFEGTNHTLEFCLRTER